MRCGIDSNKSPLIIVYPLIWDKKLTFSDKYNGEEVKIIHSMYQSKDIILSKLFHMCFILLSICSPVDNCYPCLFYSVFEINYEEGVKFMAVFTY